MIPLRENISLRDCSARVINVRSSISKFFTYQLLATSSSFSFHEGPHKFLRLPTMHRKFLFRVWLIQARNCMLVELQAHVERGNSCQTSSVGNMADDIYCWDDSYSGKVHASIADFSRCIAIGSGEKDTREDDFKHAEEFMQRIWRKA